MEVDYDYDVPDELVEKLRELIGKYGLDTIMLINKEKLKPDKTYEDIYDEELSKKRREVYDRLKQYLIEKKAKELNYKGEELLTEDNLREWIEVKGETYISIAVKYTGCLYTIVSKKAKEYGIESLRENIVKDQNIEDEFLIDISKEYSLEEILDGLHKYVTSQKNVNDMTYREKVLMELCDIREEFLVKDELERLVKEGFTARDLMEKIGCSYSLLCVYLKSYGIDIHQLIENGESKGNQIRKKMIRKKYSRY